MCGLAGVLVPFCCFFSKGESDGNGGRADLWEGESEGFLSIGEGDAVDGARLSRGDRAGLGRLSREDGGVTEPPPPRPLVSFSPERWEAGGAKEEDLSGESVDEDEEEEDEELRRTCDIESARFRQGIFSKLTTGNDTLVGGEGRRKRSVKMWRKCMDGKLQKLSGMFEKWKDAQTMSCSLLLSVGRRQAAPC